MQSLRYQYKDSGTPVHRLNPFVLLLWVTVLLILTLLFDHPLYCIALFLVTLPYVGIAGIWREWLAMMRIVLYLGIVIILINVLVVSRGATVLVELPMFIPSFGKLNITLEALCFGLMMSLRLLVIISGFAVVNYTVHPDDVMTALRMLRLPGKSVIVMSLSARFVPSLADDINRLTDVQRTRGIELDKGSWLQRIRRRWMILVPLLANSLDRTVQVAEAMESRGFGQGTGRTFYRKIAFCRNDVTMLILLVLALVLGIALNISGYGEYIFYPVLGSLVPLPADGAGIAGMFILLIIPVAFSLMKNRRSFAIDTA